MIFNRSIEICSDAMCESGNVCRNRTTKECTCFIERAMYAPRRSLLRRMLLCLAFTSAYSLECTETHCEQRFERIKPTLHSKAFCRAQGEDYEDLCYIPNLCRSKEHNMWEIPFSTLEHLKQAGSGEILENLWWYGAATVLPPGEDSVLRQANTTFIEGTTFISTVQFGASIYARYTGFPLLSLLESQARGTPTFKETMHPISTVLHVLFSPDQDKTEPWVSDLLSLIIFNYNLRILNGYSSLFNSAQHTRVCINALLYSHKNTGVLGERLRWFPGVWASDHLRSIAYPNLPVATKATGRRHAVILERRENLQGERALRLLHRDDVEKISEILSDMGFNVEVAHFEHQKFYEQARIMKEADVVVTPHGNGLINAVFMRRCSIVVEIFPYNFASPVFADLAKQTGLVYREVFNRNVHAEGDIPSCLAKNSSWLAATREECTRMLDTCLPCARSAARVYPDIDQVRQALTGAMAEQSACKLTQTLDNL